MSKRIINRTISTETNTNFKLDPSKKYSVSIVIGTSCTVNVYYADGRDENSATFTQTSNTDLQDITASTQFEVAGVPVIRINTASLTGTVTVTLVPQD